MKNTYRPLLWIICVLPTLLSTSLLPAEAQIVTNGLVSWWQAEGNGEDSFGGNPGSPHGGISFTSGEIGQAFRFNGVDSYIEVPDSDALRLTNEISVEFWVRRHSLDHEVGDFIVEKGGDWTGNQQNYAVALTPAGYNYTLVFLFAGGNRHAGMIADTNWHHCAVVARNGDVDPTFYIDGVQQSVTRREGGGTINLYPSTRPLHIGSQLDPETGWYYYGDCSIDELRIYNRLLSAEEVQTIYDATKPPSDSCISAPNGIVSWWRGEGTTSDVQNINAGILENGSTFAPGIVGQAFRFDGIDDFVRVNQHASLRITNQLTIEFWMKPDSNNVLNTYQGLLTSDFYGIEIANGYSGGPLGVEFFISTDSGASISPSSFPDTATVNGGGAQISAGEWHHVAGTYDGSKLQLYIDGQPWGNPAYHSGQISPMLPDSFLTIGAEDGRTIWAQYNGPRYFNGLIDEPAIYHRALSPQEILAIYDAGSSGKCDPSTPPSSCTAAPSGLVSWWPGENNAVDSITGSSGILSGGVEFSSGEVGQAFEFDGIDDRIVVSNSASLNFGSGQDFSIEAWIQPLPSTTDYDVMSIIDKRLAPNLSQCLGYEFNLGEGRIHCRLSDSLSGNGISVGPAGPDLRDGNFHHVALSVSHAGPSGGQLYVDGQVVASFDASAIGDLSNTEPLRIGNHASSFFNAFFKGRIDEVSLYSRGLSASEISAIYNAGAEGKCPPPFVPQAPSIVLQPVGRTNYVGAVASFRVQAIGDFPLHYQWVFENDPLADQTNRSLILPNIQPLNAGDYSVVVTNSIGAITSAVAVLTVILPPPCTPPPSGLVSWWRFEDNLLDNWGENDGFLFNASFVPGKSGAAFENFSSAIRVIDSPSLHLTNSLTLEAWIKPVPVSGKLFNTIIAKTYINPAPIVFPQFPPYPDILFPTCSFILGMTNNALFFSVLPIGSTSANVFVVAPNPLPTGQWSHVAATCDGSALRLFVNGLPAGSLSYSNGVAYSDGDLGIGGISSGSQTAQPFPGAIDEAAIYNRALSADEIESIYLSDLSGKCLMPPIIVGQPLSQTGALGEDVRFSVELQGSRPLTYQWSFNEADIPGATNATLLLENLNQSNSGFYSVSVTNLLGKVVSTSAQLKLVSAPECVSTPDGLISWWPMDGSGLDVVSGNNLQGDLSFRPGKVRDALVLTNRSFQAGVWTMFNSEVGIEILSIEAWIKAESPMVLPPPRSLNLEPILSQQGTTSPFPGKIQGYAFGLLDGHLAFQFTDVPYYPFTGKFVSGGPDLRDGSFHHVAVTMNNEIEHGGTLYVDGIPVQTFTTSSNRFTFVPGRLFIGSRSFGVITGLAGFSGKIDELAIYNRPLTTGEIAAIARAGRSSKCKVPPLIVTQPINQIVAQGSNTAFVVVATGTPALKYQWLKQGAVVPGATNANLSFTNVQPFVAGLYSVRVTNAFGSAISSNATLTVEPLAIASTGGRLSYKQSGSQWNLKFTGTAGQTYKIQASTNLVDWATIGTAVDLGGGNFEFADPDWKNRNTGFYRIVQP